jgi:DNA-binding NarL/FixJ family response regulator
MAADEATGAVRSRTILVVDDHPIVRFGVSEILRHARDFEAHVVAVPTAAEAIAQCQALHPLDLVILDIGLPDAYGLTALRAVRAEVPDTPILVLSGREERATIRQCFHEGARGYVMKSQGPEAIVTAVRILLAGERYVPPSLAPSDAVASAARKPTPDPGIDAVLAALTERQRQTYELLAAGRSNKEISRELGLALGTVKNHVSHILQRLNRERRTQLIADRVGTTDPAPKKP